MTKVKNPMKIHNVFSDEKFLELKSLFLEEQVKSFEFQKLSLGIVSYTNVWN